jgi:hypothetical protein
VINARFLSRLPDMGLCFYSWAFSNVAIRSAPFDHRCQPSCGDKFAAVCGKTKPGVNFGENGRRFG